MQRFELVADTLKKIDGTIRIHPVAKHWALDEQKNTIKATEDVACRVGAMSEIVRLLVYHKYPAEVVTYMQSSLEGEMSISTSHTTEPPCVTITVTSALIRAVAELHNLPSGEIERQNTQSLFRMVFDYVDANLREERVWRDHLCEVVD